MKFLPQFIDEVFDKAIVDKAKIWIISDYVEELFLH